MPTYLTPGVYFESTDVTTRGITAIRTDITALIGIAERGPIDEPWRVASWRQFQTLFGDHIAQGYLAYAAKAFFENGGRRAVIVRVAHDDAAPATGELLGRDGAPTLRINAASEGRWGNRLQVRLGTSRSEATQTVGAQPPAGEYSAVDSIVAFAVGTLVSLFQENASGTVNVWRVVTAVDPAGGHLFWDAPLPVLPTVPGFDLTQPIELETAAFTLTVYERGRVKALYEDLSIVPDSPRYVVDMVNLSPQERAAQERPLPLIEVVNLHAGAVPASWEDWLPDIDATTPTFSQGLLTLQCGLDGLENLTPADFTGDPGAVDRRGLRTLEEVDEVGLVAIPDILIQPVEPPVFAPLPEPEPDPCIDCPAPPLPIPPPPGPCPDIVEQPPLFSAYEVALVQQAMLLHCEQMGDRFAIVDPPLEGQVNTVDPGRVLAWRQRFDTTYGALYYPWVYVSDPLRLAGEVVRAVPPSGHVAGVIARTDLSRGVHQPPANAALSWAEGFTVSIPAEWQAILNPAHVNCLRALPGRDLRVYGARTLSSDPSYRFVNVRRLLLMIAEALRVALAWAVFEPHDVYLRQTLSLVVASFLSALWRQGALVGATPEEAFFVRCDEENNPPAVVEAGQLRMDIGVAPVHPAEFVILRIGRTNDEIEVTELHRVEA